MVTILTKRREYIPQMSDLFTGCYRQRPSRSQGVHAHPQLLDEPEQSEHKQDHDNGDDDPDNTTWSSSHSILLLHNVSAPSIHQERHTDNRYCVRPEQ